MFDFSHFSRLNPIRYVMQTLFLFSRAYFALTFEWKRYNSAKPIAGCLFRLQPYNITLRNCFHFSIWFFTNTYEHYTRTFFFIFINYNPLVAVHGGFMERIRYCFIFFLPFFLHFCLYRIHYRKQCFSLFRYGNWFNIGWCNWLLSIIREWEKESEKKNQISMRSKSNSETKY